MLRSPKVESPAPVRLTEAQVTRTILPAPDRRNSRVKWRKQGRAVRASLREHPMSVPWPTSGIGRNRQDVKQSAPGKPLAKRSRRRHSVHPDQDDCAVLLRPERQNYWRARVCAARDPLSCRWSPSSQINRPRGLAIQKNVENLVSCGKTPESPPPLHHLALDELASSAGADTNGSRSTSR